MALTIEPTGPLSLPLKHLRDLVAASTTFQGLVGAGSAAAAKAKILVDDTDEMQAGQGIPRAIVGWAYESEVGKLNYHWQKTSNTSWVHMLPLRLIFEFTVPEAYRPTANDREWQNARVYQLNQVGQILDEFKTLIRANGDLYLNIDSLRFIGSNVLDPKKHPGLTAPACSTAFIVEWR